MQLAIKEFDQGTSVAAPVVTGLCAGARVITLRGEVPVDSLIPGDKVVTRDSGLAVVRDVTASTQTFSPIRIKAGSLGHARPDHDMITTPGAQLHIRDWRAQALYGRTAAAIPAARLVDGEFVSEDAPCDMRVFQIAFDHPHIIYADGVEMFISV